MVLELSLQQRGMRVGPTGLPAESLTILAVADQVSEALYDYFVPERWRHIDLILSCGDVPPGYLDFLCSTLNVPVVYVRGNHDGMHSLDQYDGLINAHGRLVTVKGVRIAGFEGCHRYNGGPLQYSEWQMRVVLERVRLQSLLKGSPHIILSHAPIRGCCDGTDRCHLGFACFHTAVRAWRPSLFLHGHMHAYNGRQPVITLGDTKVINPFPHRVITLPVPGARSISLTA